MLFDNLVVGQVIPNNPAASVRGPKYSTKKGKTPVLTQDETQTLIRKIDTGHLVGLRDRALIGTMVYTFARVSAVINRGRPNIAATSRKVAMLGSSVYVDRQ